MNEDMSLFNFSPKTNKTLEDNMLNKKNSKKKPKKQQKPYYSDDEDDDSDDVDDEETMDDEDDSTDENTDQELEKTKIKDTSNSKSSLDNLENLENSIFSDAVITKAKTFNNNSIKLDADTGFVIQSTTPQPDVVTKSLHSNSASSTNGKKHIKSSSSSTSSSSSAALINQLINQEKRNLGTPINPFPVRHVNSNIARNGVRLGLYKL